MRQSHLIISNASIMWMTRLLLVLPQLVLVPFLIKNIGESGYGIYVLIWSLMASIDQLEMSLQQGVVKYSAAFLAQKRIDDVNKVVSCSFVYSLFISVVISIGILITAKLYPDSDRQMSASLILIGVMILFIVPLTPYVAIIQSRQRYYIGAVAETISKYLSLLIVIVWFQMLGPSLGALIFIMAAMLLLARLVQVPVAYRLIPGLRNRPSLFDKNTFRLIAWFGAATVLASLCLAANTTGIRWMMGSLISTSFVAHLAIMLMPGLLMGQITLAMTITIMPATSAYEATGDQSILRELLIRGMRYTMIVAMAGLLAAGLLMRKMLDIWVGADYLFLTPYALVLFAGVAFLQSTSVAHHMLKGLGKLRVVVLIYFTSLVIVPVILILVIYQLCLNPYIAATVGLFTGNVVCGCLNVCFCARAVGIDLSAIAIRVYSQTLLIAGGSGLIGYLVLKITGLDRFGEHILLAILIVILFVVGCYTIFATAEERKQAKVIIRAVRNKLMP